MTTGVGEALTSLEPAGQYFRKGRRSWGLTLKPQGVASYVKDQVHTVWGASNPNWNQIRRTVISIDLRAKGGPYLVVTHYVELQ
jgi:hypothetical protein